MQGPIKTNKRFEDTLDHVYELLKKNIRINSFDYVKLGCYSVQLCQYRHSVKFYVSDRTEQTYQKIHCILRNQKTQRMLGRLGLQLLLSHRGEILYRNSIIIGPPLEELGPPSFSNS